MTLGHPGSSRYVMHAQENALSTSKAAITKASINDGPPECMMHEQPRQTSDAKRENGTTRKLGPNLECERRARKNQQRDSPQDDDFSDLQIQIHQRAWLIKSAFPEKRHEDCADNSSRRHVPDKINVDLEKEDVIDRATGNACRNNQQDVEPADNRFDGRISNRPARSAARAIGF